MLASAHKHKLYSLRVLSLPPRKASAGSLGNSEAARAQGASRSRGSATSALEETSDSCSLAAGVDSGHSPAMPCLFSQDVFKQKVPNPGLLDLTILSLPFLFFWNGPMNLLGHFIFLFLLWTFFLYVYGHTFHSLPFPFAWVQANEQ